jgi:signal transduction histidine kinase
MEEGHYTSGAPVDQGAHPASLRDEALALLHRMRLDPPAVVRGATERQQQLLQAPATDDQQAAIAMLDVVIVSGFFFASTDDDVGVRIDRAKRIAEDLGDLDLQVRAHRIDAIRWRQLGRFAAHNRAVVAALAVSRRLNNRRLQTVLMVDLAVALIAIGAGDRALKVLDSVADDYLHLRPEYPAWNRAMLARYRAAALLRLGRYEDCLACVEAAFDEETFGDAGMLRWYLWATCAEAMRGLGIPRCPEFLEMLANHAVSGVGRVGVEVRALLHHELAEQLAATEPERALALARDTLEGQPLSADASNLRSAFLLVARLAEHIGDQNLAIETLRSYATWLEESTAHDAEATRELIDSEEALHVLRHRHAEVELRSSELSQIVDRLSDLHADMETLVQDAVHDLGGPLTALEFATQRLSANAGDQVAPRSLAFIQSAVDSIRDIVRGMSHQRDDASRAGRLPVDGHVALDRLVRGALPTFQAMAAVKGSRIELAIEAIPPVYADRVHLRRILTNLLSNAIKFSPPGATVRVELRTEERHVVVSVADQGPGFPDGFAEHVARGVRHDATPTAGEASTGLGLSIVLRYAEEMGARVTFSNTEFGGAVRVLVPFA